MTQTATDFGIETVKTLLALDSGIQIEPGPISYEGAADTVNRAVVITIGGGPGLTLEQTYDRILVSVDVAGYQHNHQSAHDLARDIDRKMLAVSSTRDVGNVRVAFINRAGGPPVPVSVDDGDRLHLGCSYLWQVRSGVA